MVIRFAKERVITFNRNQNEKKNEVIRHYHDFRTREKLLGRGSRLVPP